MSSPVNQIIHHQIRLSPPVGSHREKTSALRVSSSFESWQLMCSCWRKCVYVAAATGILHGFVSVRYAGPACWVECPRVPGPSRMCDWHQNRVLQYLVYIPQVWQSFTKRSPDCKLMHKVIPRSAHIVTNSQRRIDLALLDVLVVFLHSSQRLKMLSLTSSKTIIPLFRTI